MPDGHAARQVDRGINYFGKEIKSMMGFGFLMMFVVLGLPFAGIVILVIWLMNRSKK